MPKEKKKEKKVIQPITSVLLRSYPKVIFLYPLLFISLVLWPIQFVLGASAQQLLSELWIIFFFCNLFVMAFDFSSTKFFILVLAIVILVLLTIFLILPIYTGPSLLEIQFNIGLTTEFYMTVTIILTVILGFVIIDGHFDYWKIERNEIYHKKGLFSSAERFPTTNLHIKKEIPDVFEFFTLRAGSITLMAGKADEVIILDTVPNINKKAEQIDYLLSHISVEPDELDTK